MVDFNELLGREPPKASPDPLEIFEHADRKSGRDYLRPPQIGVLKEWYENDRGKKDVIVKLHTGQGKTLIGLLMLQSTLNEIRRPALYLCPSYFLVSQTCRQAEESGIQTVQVPEDSTALPREFLNSQKILVAHVKKLFNGKSIFGVSGGNAEPVGLGGIVMDDAHKCLEEIRGQFSIRVPRKLTQTKAPHPVYQKLLDIFGDPLKRQAAGTFREIEEGTPTSFLAVPFWSWRESQDEIVRVLSEHKEEEGLLFSWDLIKNALSNCTCVFSGLNLEITPRLAPLPAIPSFVEAARRIYLTATLTEDSFLVRDLGLNPETVTSPLSKGDVNFSGERLIVLPSLVNNKLSRERIIAWLMEFSKKSKSAGFAAIVPSNFQADDWRKCGARVTNVDTLEDAIRTREAEVARKTVSTPFVLLNAYDGVDLPDDVCRVLCMDSLPSYSSIYDRYLQEARHTSRISKRQRAQRVEQGLGRAIRGTGDWCVVVAIGNGLTSFLSENSKSEFLSSEVRTQIAIGEELAEQLKKEGQDLLVVQKLIQQCLERDEGWKAFYRARMSKVTSEPPNPEFARRAASEREAEIAFQQGHVQTAVELVDKLIADASDPSDQGWYLQLKACYLFETDRPRSMEVQLKARTLNSNLFMPPTGISYSKITTQGADRARRVLQIVQGQNQWNAVWLHLETVLDKLAFGRSADSFEEGIDQLGKLLGFVTQRPDHDFHKGPDNLWCVGGSSYWVIDCKNEVARDREHISKGEAEQIGSSTAWFDETYEGSTRFPLLIHPSRVLAPDAFKTCEFSVTTPESLEGMKRHVSAFYHSMGGHDFRRLSEAEVGAAMASAVVSPGELRARFTEVTKDSKSKRL
jgi:hypothetical protein